MIMVNTVRRYHTTSICFTEIGIWVDKIQGMDAEKNNMDEIEITPITNFVTKTLLAAIRAGRNISAKPVAEAVDTSIGSGSCSTHANG